VSSRSHVWSCAALAAALAALPASSLQAAKQGAPLPSRPLPAPPTLPLIRIEASRDHVVVIEDILLRRGDWVAGDVDLFISFGAPGVPRALDARLYSAAEDEPMPNAYESVAVSRSFRRPSSARLLLGSSLMAGAVLHVPAPMFERATQASRVARLRVRTLLDAPRPDARSGRELVIRLGSHRGEPDALDSIEIAGEDPQHPVTRAEAHLCGPDADRLPLAIHAASTSARPLRAEAGGLVAVAPVLSVRHSSDDLCVRYWTDIDP